MITPISINPSLKAKQYCILQSSELVGRKPCKIWFEQKQFHCKKKKKVKDGKELLVDISQIGINYF